MMLLSYRDGACKPNGENVGDVAHQAFTSTMRVTENAMLFLDRERMPKCLLRTTSRHLESWDGAKLIDQIGKLSVVRLLASKLFSHPERFRVAAQLEPILNGRAE